MGSESDDGPLGRTDASTERVAAKDAVSPGTDPLDGTSYRAIARLRESLTSEVFVARHVKLDKEVVVKIARQSLAIAPDAADRMRLQSQALARLSDEHIVRVIDCGVTEGRPFFVMDRLAGRSLAEELRDRRTLPVSEALDIAQQTLAGLKVVHASGLLHRDIHPDNLFLHDPGPGQGRVVKILDFDVLKLASGPEKLGLKPLEVPTADGVALGTPRYSPPEQTVGQPVDERADLYAVGAVLYRMLVGREPFAHCEGIADVLRAQLSEDPPLPSRVARQPIPPALDALIQQALSPEPAARPRSAEAFMHALSPLVEEPARASADPTSAPELPGRALGPVELPTRRSSRRLRAGSLLIVAVGVVGAGVVGVLWREGAREVAPTLPTMQPDSATSTMQPDSATSTIVSSTGPERAVVQASPSSVSTAASGSGGQLARSSEARPAPTERPSPSSSSPPISTASPQPAAPPTAIPETPPPSSSRATTGRSLPFGSQPVF